MTAERVCDLMAEILQRDVDLSLLLGAEGGVAPLDVARFAILGEKAFGVTIQDECAAEWRTLADAAAYIESLIEAGESEKAIKDDEERTDWFYA